MKVLLINPPNENEVTGYLPSFITSQRGANPPLGLLYLAGYLQKFSQHEINILDCQVDEVGFEELEVKASEYMPDIVGITTLTMALIDVQKTIDAVNRANEQIKIVLGGPHVHLYPDETIQIKGVDYVVQGEGEEVFCKLLDNLDNNAKLKNIKGLVFKDEGQIVNTGLADFIDDINQLPFPARKLTPYKKYTSILTKEANVTTIFTSRGCPYGCTFCDRHHLGKKFRARSAQNVLDEIQECVDMGIYGFLFYDDTFTIDKQRVIDICQGMIDRNLKITWNIRSRVDTIDKEMLSYLKKAGCVGVNYGVESGSDRILKRLNKGITIDKVFETFKDTRASGIPALAYFMLGNPGEQIEDINKSFEVMRKLKPDYVHITVLTPFPGTRIYQEALEKEIIAIDCWQDFAQHPSYNFKMPHWGEYFSMSELSELLRKGYKGFYCNPGYIIKSIFKMRSLNEFKMKASAGLRLLTSSKKTGPCSMNSNDINGDLNGLLSGYLAEKRINAIKPYLQKRKNICDIGCGVFRWDGILSKDTTYTGIDIERDIVHYNTNNYNYEFYLINAEHDELDKIGTDFDLIIMLAIIEHFKDPASVLKKLAGIIAPDGIIALTTPHPFGDIILNIGAKVGIFSSDKHTHNTLLNKKTLNDIAISSGFKVQEYKRFLLGFNQLAILVPEAQIK